MVWNRTLEHTMLGAPEFMHRWDEFFFIHEQALTWRDDPLWLHMIPFIASVLYIWMVYSLPPFLMKHATLRKTIQAHIKPYMIGWNLFLCILSIFMFVGIGVPTLFFYHYEGYWGVVCNGWENVIPPMGSHIFWTATFGYSKFLELLDTLFLILKNPERPVPFLHWYHHFSVLYFTWYAANWKLSSGLLFSLVNSLVHSFMYWYYFQKERGIDPTWAKPLTVAQILQMVFGLFLNIVWFVGVSNGFECACVKPKTLTIMGVTIYASYLFLFMKYFLERYVFGSKKPSGGDPTKGKPTTTGPKRPDGKKEE